MRYFYLVQSLLVLYREELDNVHLITDTEGNSFCFPENLKLDVSCDEVEENIEIGRKIKQNYMLSKKSVIKCFVL